MRSVQLPVVVLLLFGGPPAWGESAKPAKTKSETVVQPAQISLPPPRIAVPATLPASTTVTIGSVPLVNVISAEMPADVQQRVSCVIQIDSERSAVPYEFGQARFDANMVAMLVSSTAFSEPAAQAELKLPAGQLGRQVLVNGVASGNRFVRLEVSLKKGNKAWPADAANRLLRALVARVRAAAEQSARAESSDREQRLMTANEQLRQAKGRCAEIGRSLRAINDVLGQNGEFYNYNDPSYMLRNLRQQKRQTESELARLKSRLAALEPEKSQSDAVSAWEAAVKSQDERLTLLREMAKAGKIGEDKIADQIARLAEAKGELATARANALAPARSRRYGDAEIQNLKASIAEQQSRLKPLAEQLAKLEAPGFQEKLAGCRDLQQEEQHLRNEVSSLSQRLSQLKSLAGPSGVLITVLDGRTE
jgi:hypothetical protein